jgi:signal transduction histidine kinase
MLAGAGHADVRCKCKVGSFMGSRGRSIRLRIYFLVAIPLVALVGLLAYVAGTSINNAVNLDRTPNLINATALPAATFGTYLETERTAAVVYLSRPTAANLQAYQAAIAGTDQHEAAFKAAMTSPATVSGETPSEAAAVSAVVGGLGKLQLLRAGVQARALSPLDALAAYSQGLAAEPKLFLAEADSETVTSQFSQAIGLIAVVQAREELSQEDALLSGMLARKRITSPDRVAFVQMAATRQADEQYAENIVSPANLAIYNAALAGSAAMQQDLTKIEQGIAAGMPAAKLPVTQAQWHDLAGTLLTDQFNGGVAVAHSILVEDHQISHSAWVTVAVAGGLGLLGLLITIAFSTLVGRGIIRGLRGLEGSALTLAEDQLPDVVSRLRRGEDVDVAAEAPPLRTGRRDEIGRVAQAFDQVRQTAIRAAVEEARLRRGLNDVFRSLARRSQSLLHRQLALLDQMERRATDPSALDDLFRLDHLTTRMRRHAEGLVILAGAPSGRSWSSPVRMIDVMRGAIAEVEDYARVSVATRSQAALAGSAVADVIHLLAELVENATTLSPPYTSVRVSGDTVANGFAIEVEDRGLGMSPQRLAELNERLASPPEFNPSDSEQLGLFVVGQLAKRHGIRVTLKASPYGGTTAVVLIPQHLVVTEEAFRAGLPGDSRAGLPGDSRAGLPEAFRAGLPEAFRAGLPEGFPAGLPGPGLAGVGTPGASIPGEVAAIDVDRPIAPVANGNHATTELAGRAGFGSGPGAFAAAGSSGLEPGTGPQAANGQDLPFAGPAAEPQPTAGAGPAGAGPAGAQPAGAGPAGAGAGPGPAGESPPAVAAQAAADGGAATFDVFLPMRRGQGIQETHGDGETLVPGAGTAPYQDQPAPFPGWNAPAGPATPMTPVASPRTGKDSGPPWELSRQTGPLPVIPADDDAGAQAPGPDGGDASGLPRRVKQANLAPQLRDNPLGRRTAAGGATSGGAPTGGPLGGAINGPTPAEIRETMSALQRGWQEGRSSAAEQQPASGDRGPGADEPRGESDGS